MSKKDKLFTEELARRNPDWDKIVAAHNAALAAQKRDLWEKISLSRIEADNWKSLYEKQTAALAKLEKQ